MRKLVVVEFLSLDGVYQAPGHPDEDREGGFEHEGWQMPYFDEVMGQAAAEGMADRRAAVRPHDVRDDGRLRRWSHGSHATPRDRRRSTRRSRVRRNRSHARLEDSNEARTVGYYASMKNVRALE